MEAGTGLLNAWKLTLVALCCASLFGLASAGPAAAKPAKTGLTIQPWAEGLFGYVSSPNAEACATNRRVIVFQQLGKARKPGTDKRVVGDRSGDAAASYQWSVEAPPSGRFYAQAPKKAGCEAALSKTIRSVPPGDAPGVGERTDYPPCGPYVSEGTSEVCRFDRVHMDLESEGATSPCRFGNSSGGCSGAIRSGLFPWGKNAAGEGTRGRISWGPNGSIRSVSIVTWRLGQGAPAASLDGTVPNAGSPRLTITDGFAQNDLGWPGGDHFYTPDIPGQAAGEPGGPLAINFQNGSGLSFGAEVDITGYLYLKR
jgi:hypothetical protein